MTNEKGKVLFGVWGEEVIPELRLVDGCFCMFFVFLWRFLLLTHIFYKFAAIKCFL